MARASAGRPLLHDDDPAEGPESPEQDPLAALIRPAERNSLVDPGAADAFQKRANLAEDRLTEVLNAYRKLKTENEGFRDRITRNLEHRFDQRRERLLLKFIEILDNLDRALEATEQTYTGTPMIEGIILVRTQLLSVLQEEGPRADPRAGHALRPERCGGGGDPAGDRARAPPRGGEGADARLPAARTGGARLAGCGG